MNFVKIKDTFVNLDNVNAIKYDRKVGKIVFVVGGIERLFESVTPEEYEKFLQDAHLKS